MKRTPWFSAQKQPPVNGGPGAWYEVRCAAFPSAKPWRKSRWNIEAGSCPHCQWRGLTKPAKGEK